MCLCLLFSLPRSTIIPPHIKEGSVAWLLLMAYFSQGSQMSTPAWVGDSREHKSGGGGGGDKRMGMLPK